MRGVKEEEREREVREERCKGRGEGEREGRGRERRDVEGGKDEKVKSRHVFVNLITSCVHV